MIYAHSRAAATALACCSLLAAAACRPDDSRVELHDTAEGVLDTARASSAHGIAVVMTSENVFALLDTAYAAAERTAALARQRAQREGIRNYAETAQARHRTARLELGEVAREMSLSPILPDYDVLEQQREAIAGLQTATGPEFDELYLEHSRSLHEELLEHVRRNLEQPSDSVLRQFLEGQERKLETEIRIVEELKEASRPAVAPGAQPRD